MSVWVRIPILPYLSFNPMKREIAIIAIIMLFGTYLQDLLFFLGFLLLDFVRFPFKHFGLLLHFEGGVEELVLGLLRALASALSLLVAH